MSSVIDRDRGMTLVEMLLALTLLSSLGAAMASWSVFALRGATEGREPIQWRAAVDRVFLQIEEDLLVGDGDQSDRAGRVEVFDGGLQLRTRRSPPDGGPVVHEYALDEARGVLLRTAGAGPGRTLLPETRGLVAELGPDGRMLDIRIESRFGSILSRSYRVP